ncbi:copper chaperone PCu(A)C [Arenimonas oryziterrae]|uniref:Copper chaperone PCu(A)C n=1 Tax=Arenimonas oryziterrae DSM 21050 = YC6267 TaxID=1121015 RepID=A0A091BKQ6_9GAMM|nr:copper chaperone PCu(A)C [Arenimonas oryziterrae]KFN44885.1 hypothetical protein N789_02380 [Arenimonas oryziterrae DSM 21050 = YC6267]
MRLARPWFLALLVVLPLIAAAHEFKVGALKIGHPWARATPPNAQVAAGYLKIDNTGRRNDRLVSVTTRSAARVEIHEMVREVDIMVMRQLNDGLPIPAGKQVVLEPYRVHLMFIGPTQPWKDGDRIKATLHFARAGKVDVEFAVAGIETPPSSAPTVDPHAGH